MNCHRYRQQRLLDLEAGTVSTEARLHALACNQCRTLDEEEQRLRTELRTLAMSEQAPPALRQWVRANYPHSERTKWRWSMRRWAITAAAVLLVSASAGSILWEHSIRSPSPQHLAQAFVADYLEFLPGREEISADSPRVAKQWLQGRVNFPVQVPKVPGAKLESARICNIAGHKAALLQYRHSDSNTLISFFVAAEPTAYKRQEIPIRVETSNLGVQSRLWCHRGLIYDVVGSSGGPPIKQIAKAVQEQIK